MENLSKYWKLFIGITLQIIVSNIRCFGSFVLLLFINICFVAAEKNLVHNTTAIESEHNYIVCNSVAELHDLSLIEVDLLNKGRRKGVLLYGYYFGGDFDRPVYLSWNRTSTVLEDNGSVFKLKRSLRGRLTNDSKTVDVRQFGLQSKKDCSDKFIALLKYAFEKGVTITSPDHFEFIVSKQLFHGDRVRGIFFSLGKANSLKVVNKNYIDHLIHVQNNNFPYDVNCDFNNLVVDCNSKSNGFLLLESKNVTLSGTVSVENVTILNCYKSMKYNNAAWALGVMGTFAEVVIRNVVVNQVTFDPRSVYGAEAKGIVLTDFEGAALIENCIVKRVRTSSGIDADGFAVHSKYNGKQQTKGRARFVNCEGYDNQGRHIKSQCSNTTIEGGYYERKDIISIEQGVDFDFQAGNGIIKNVEISYKIGSGNKSPLSAYFMTVAAQNIQLDNIKSTSMINLTVNTEVIIPKFAHLFNGGERSKLIIDGVNIKSNLKNVIGRSFCEFVGDEVRFGGLDLEIKNCVFSSTAPFLGYTSTGEWNLMNTLNIRLENNSAGPYSKNLHHLSGKQIHYSRPKVL